MLIGDIISKSVIAWLCLLSDAIAQEAGVPISFLPPPLENATYSLGIYEAKSGKLVRTLQQSATESVFTVGLNGLIAKWDRKDDAGKIVPPGKYAARGYAVGPLKVEGVAFHGNDWVEQDESLRIQNIKTIALVPEDEGLAVVAEAAGDYLLLLRISGKDGSLIWKQNLDSVLDSAAEAIRSTVHSSDDPAARAKRKRYFEGIGINNGLIDVVANRVRYVYRVSDGAEDTEKRHVSSPDDKPHSDSLNITLDRWPVTWGKDKTLWWIGDDGVNQIASEAMSRLEFGANKMPSPQDLQKFTLRRLARKPEEPAAKIIAASTVQDRLYLLEEMPGWQRVRGLSWVETKDEGGKQVSTWETFFERNIRIPDPSLSLEDPTTAKAPSPVIEMTLAENELSPGKPAKVKLTATFDDKGSYLSTADGLRLRKIGERANLRAVKLAKAKAPGSLSFFQTDGAAWDEFSIDGADKIMGFDAGEFELTASGEKPADAKPPEPDL